MPQSPFEVSARFPASPPHRHRGRSVPGRAGLAKNLKTLREIRRFPDLAKFVVAYLLYGNGVQTVVALTAVYSAQTLGLGQTTIIIGFLIVQIVSIPAAYGAGKLATRTGAKTTLSLALIAWVAAIGGAYLLPEGAALAYYGLAFLIGLILAPVTRSAGASTPPSSQRAARVEVT